jgi:prevent-host-death family protein
MIEAGIAEVKARLSEYLRAVRRGETVTIVDRTTPVAQIVPLRERHSLRVRKPRSEAPRLGDVPRPKSMKLAVDVVKLLLEERRERG